MKPSRIPRILETSRIPSLFNNINLYVDLQKVYFLQVYFRIAYEFIGIKKGILGRIVIS